jgi:uncharacterized membrane protein
MLLEELKNIDSSKKEIKKFSYQVGTVCIVLGLILSIVSKTIHYNIIIAGIFLITAGILRPILLFPIHKLWMGFSVILGFISTRVILLIIYYFVLTPIAIIGRLTGKDFLDEKIDKSKKSYWSMRKEMVFNDNLKRQF